MTRTDSGRLLRRLALLCASLAFATVCRAEKWPTTDFEVFVGSNTTSANSIEIQLIRYLDDILDIDFTAELARPVAPEVIDEMESYLGEVARTLEAGGFHAPHLEPIVTRDDGTRAYRVYLVDLPDQPNAKPQPPARYVSDCTRTGRPVILINALKSLSGGKLTDKAYQDLPHELFHAIQQRYPLVRDNCHLGDWIVEGTAQAMGADLAAWSSRRKSYPNRGKGWMRDRWGRRAYDTQLWIPDDDDRANAGFYTGDDAYGASSFWRYLGELAATSGAAGTLIVKPDYRYLHDFLQAGLPGGPGEQAEYQWLEARLRAHPKFRTGLGRLYPNFISTFASYVPDRFLPRGFLPADAQDGWLQILFPLQQCPVVSLAGANTGYRGKLAIPGNAAACLRLALDYAKPVDLHIEVDGADREQLRALSVGTAAGQIVAKPWIKSAAGIDSASFMLHIADPGTPGSPMPLLVFSNVAQSPETTRLIRANVHIVPASHTHNMLPAPARRPAPRRSAAQSGDKAPEASLITAGTQARRVAGDIAEGLEDLNPNLLNSATQFAHADAMPCRDAFVEQVCGPHTNIRLETVPGMFASTVQATGRGGVFGQFASMLSGIAAIGPMEASGRYEAALQHAQQYDGASVIIDIPLVDYGFRGTFNNAAIRVSKRGGGSYEAVGPADLQPGPGAVFALSGQVTIEEFSTAVMRGTYAGDLVDRDDLQYLVEDAPLPVKQHISGRFQIAAPWIEDGRVAREGAEDVATAVAADVGAAMPGTNPDLGEWRDSVAAARDGTAADSPADGGGHAQPCYCSCNTASTANPACLDYCAATFAACAGDPVSAETLAALTFKPRQVQAEQVRASADPYLLSLPEARTLLDDIAAAGLLDAAGAAEYVSEWLPEVLSSITWKAREDGRRRVGLRMLFGPLDLYDSRSQTAEEFRQAALGFNILQVRESKSLSGPGKMALLADFGDSTVLYVLTGIYGRDPDSGNFVSELLMTWELQHSALTPGERGVRLLGMAGPQVAALQALAATSHEGAPGAGLQSELTP